MKFKSDEMFKKILLISEALSAPFDEGIKNVAFSLYSQFNIRGNILTVTNAENVTDNLDVTRINLNKLFINYKLLKVIKRYSPDIIFYLPETSITFNSFLRGKTLKLMHRLSKVVILGIQHRKYSTLQDILIAKFLRPDLLFLLGEVKKNYYIEKGFKVKMLPPAVNNMKFCICSEKEKVNIREKYNISHDTKVVLHVGHIKLSRNIECFNEIQKITNTQVVIVGSTTTKTDIDLKRRLLNDGIRIIDEFVADISEVYKMSDIYVFPVRSKTAAIDMPLSILEAMACNLPVITTRFGGLVDYFEEDEVFKYFDTEKELVELIGNICMTGNKNREKVDLFSWHQFVNEILISCEEI